MIEQQQSSYAFKNDLIRCYIHPSMHKAMKLQPSTGMTNITFQENLDRKLVDWMEKVTELQYRM